MILLAQQCTMMMNLQAAMDEQGDNSSNSSMLWPRFCETAPQEYL